MLTAGSSASRHLQAAPPTPSSGCVLANTIASIARFSQESASRPLLEAFSIRIEWSSDPITSASTTIIAETYGPISAIQTQSMSRGANSFALQKLGKIRTGDVLRDSPPPVASDASLLRKVARSRARGFPFRAYGHLGAHIAPLWHRPPEQRSSRSSPWCNRRLDSNPDHASRCVQPSLRSRGRDALRCFIPATRIRVRSSGSASEREWLRDQIGAVAFTSRSVQNEKKKRYFDSH